MNPRERTIVMVIGGLIGVWALYQGVTRFVFGPADRAVRELNQARNEHVKLKRERDTVKRLGATWRDLTARTYSFDDRDTQNAFGDDLKRLTEKHRLSGARFTPRSVAKIARSDVRVMSYVVTAGGKLSDVTAFLAELYRLPALTRVRRLKISPVKQVGGSDEVKIDELLIETPILLSANEQVDVVKRELRTATTMPAEHAARPGPHRAVMPTDADVLLVARRNIFKAFEPPPALALTIDNQDLNEVEIVAEYFWKGEGTKQPPVRVGGKSKRDLSGGAGEAVEVTATYADGKVVGPQRLTTAGGKPAVFTAPAYSKPPPPTTFVYKARNDGPDPVSLEVVITAKGGPPKTWPLMQIAARQTIDLPELQGERLLLTGVYGDGARSAPGTFDVASAATGTYVIPVKPTTPNGKPPEPPPASLPPPNPDLTVTGLIASPDVNEMIAMNAKTKKRELFPIGEKVDGGELIAVLSPEGAIVKMPGGIYFLYPLGKKFTERYQLPARSDSEVAMAVEEWSRQ